MYASVLETDMLAAALPLPAAQLQAVENEHADLLQLLWGYHQTARDGWHRQALMAILDEIHATLIRHFQTEEALLELTTQEYCLAHKAIHRQHRDELLAFRARLASGEVLDPVECCHALDGLLIHLIMERPVFKNWRSPFSPTDFSFALTTVALPLRGADTYSQRGTHHV